MNILVILRAVRDPLGLTVNRRAQKVFVNREAYIFNPSDRNALEAALRLDGAVVAVAFGDAPAAQVLQDARAMGVARAILVKDKRLGSADGYMLTNVLCRLLDHISGADLILCGAEVIDADLAQVGPRLAHCLGRPFVADAHQVSLDHGTFTAIVARGRQFHKVEASLPAVVSVARDSNKPRYAPGANLINTYSDAGAIETLTVADLGLDEAELAPVTEARGESFPPEREPGRRLDGDIAAQLAQIIGRV